MPVGHYQLFKFSLASEAVLPDNRTVAVTHLSTCVLERVMGTVFARRALPASVDRAVENSVNLDTLYLVKLIFTARVCGEVVFSLCLCFCLVSVCPFGL